MLSGINAHSVTHQPEAGDFKAAERLFGLSRTSFYRLETAGQIRFFRVRMPGHVTGKVLVDFGSVRRYLERCATENERAS